MARKTLLTEAQIRSFIKLANIGPVGDTKLQEWYDDQEEGIEEQEEEDELEMDAEDVPGEGEVPGAEAGLEMDAELGDDELGMDAELGAPDELDAGVGGDKEAEFKDLVQQLADLVGVEVDIDDEGAEGEELGADLGADLEGGEEAGEELPMPGEEEIGMGPVADDEEEEELPGMRNAYQEGKSQDDIVNEVARRVAARLSNQNKKSKMVNDLAERIFNRLTSK